MAWKNSRPNPHVIVEQKGYDAAKAGKTRDQCPYQDHRTAYGNITGARGIRKAWFRGFNRFHKEKSNKG